MYEPTDATVTDVALALAGVENFEGTSPTDADAWREDARYALAALRERRRIFELNGVRS